MSGEIKDGETGEQLAYATVYAIEAERGVSANDFGFFSITLPVRPYTFVVSHVGYAAQDVQATLRADTTIVFELWPSVETLDEVEIVDAPQAALSGLNQEIFTPAEIARVPVIMGETDVLKAIQVLPGIQAGNEGSAGIYVRGGGPDQNMILLDGAPIYHAGHVFGFLSVFNTDAVQSVRVIKGGFPARYGGRLSSVIDIDMREGNTEELDVRGSISPVAVRMSVEGPLQKDRSAFIVSARRTFLDVLLNPVLQDENTELGYYFYDLNGKINHVFSPNTRMYASVYAGRDRYFNRVEEVFAEEVPQLTELDNEGLGWRNTSATWRVTHIAGPRLFGALTALYSRYRLASTDELGFEQGDRIELSGVDYASGIRDFTGKLDVDYFVHDRHSLKAGLYVTHHAFTPRIAQLENVQSASSGQAIRQSANQQIDAVEGGAYLEDEMRLSSSWSVNAGVHASWFTVEGTDYSSVQPRFATRFQLAPGQEITASYTWMEQYIHLLTPSGVGVPTDLWLPSTNRVKPEKARQWTLGYAIRLPGVEVQLEGYIKEMEGLLEYKEGASFSGTNQDWQDKVEQGDGRARGIELLLRKPTGRLTGFLGYTLARSDRAFENLNEGRQFPYRYDRRHDVSLLLTYHLSDRRALTGSWVYGTGQALTVPSSWYADPLLIDVFTYYRDRGNFRAPALHRLDVSYTIDYTATWGTSTLGLHIYNLYNRRNTFYLFFDALNEVDLRTEDGFPRIKQKSLFPVIPSISYSFSF